MQALRNTLARNTAVFQTVRGVAKKAAPEESIGQKWAVDLIAEEAGPDRKSFSPSFFLVSKSCPPFILISHFHTGGKKKMWW